MPKRRRERTANQSANFAQSLHLVLEFLPPSILNEKLFNNLCLVSKYVRSQRNNFISKFEFHLNREGLSYWSKQDSKTQPRKVVVYDITQEDVQKLAVINPYSLDCLDPHEYMCDFSQLFNVTNLCMDANETRLPFNLPPNLKVLTARCRQLPSQIPTLECLDYISPTPFLRNQNADVVYPNLKCLRIVDSCGMPNLAESKELEFVSLQEGSASRLEIRNAFLYNLTKLKVLRIAATPKTDFFLNLPLLEIVQISHGFPDNDLSCFINCSNLKVLEINFTCISDISLLKTMPKLQFCHIPKTMNMVFTTTRFMSKLRREFRRFLTPNNGALLPKDKFDITLPTLEDYSYPFILDEQDLATITKSPYPKIFPFLKKRYYPFY